MPEIKDEVLSLLMEFYKHLLDKYHGQIFSDAFPIALEEFRKIKSDPIADLFCEAHKELDINKCVALAVVGKHA